MVNNDAFKRKKFRSLFYSLRGNIENCGKLLQTTPSRNNWQFAFSDFNSVNEDVFLTIFSFFSSIYCQISTQIFFIIIALSSTFDKQNKKLIENWLKNDKNSLKGPAAQLGIEPRALGYVHKRPPSYPDTAAYCTE